MRGMPSPINHQFLTCLKGWEEKNKSLRSLIWDWEGLPAALCGLCVPARLRAQPGP